MFYRIEQGVFWDSVSFLALSKGMKNVTLCLLTASIYPLLIVSTIWTYFLALELKTIGY